MAFTIRFTSKGCIGGLLGALLLAGALVWLSVPYPAQAGEQITPEVVTNLTKKLFRDHLRQNSYDPVFMRNIVNESLENLDPAKIMYLQSEAEVYTKLTDEQIKDLIAKAQAGDFSYFRKIADDFVAVQVARDKEFYATLDGKIDVARRILKEADERLEKQARDGITQADEDEDLAEDAHLKKWPANQAEREERVMKIVAANFRAYKFDSKEEEAYKRALATTRQAWERWTKIDPAKDTPKFYLRSFMSAMDPHTLYTDYEEDEGLLEHLKGSFYGIGVQIRTSPLGCYVDEVIEHTPAHRSGRFDKGDQITEVGGKALAGMPINQIVRLIKGPENTEVSLRLIKRSTNSAEIVTLKRTKIELGGFRVKGKVFDTPAGKVGVVSLAMFFEDCSQDVEKRINELQAKHGALAGLVLDLRGNTGGYLDEAVNLAGLFIGKGPVVGQWDGLIVDGKTVREGTHKPKWNFDTNDKVAYDGPLVVLINQGSASASEIVAGALKDYGRAVIAGPTETHGKGTVQAPFLVLPKYYEGNPLMRLKFFGKTEAEMRKLVKEMGEGKVTIESWYTPSGNAVQQKGVTPDVKILGGKLLEARQERAYPNAIPFTTIPGALDNNRPDVKEWSEIRNKAIPTLVENSKKRIETNQAYKDAFDLKLVAQKILERKKKAEANPGQPLEDDLKDEKDFQQEEAAMIAGDLAAQWPKATR